MRHAAASSIRVSTRTSKRVGELVSRLHASSKEEVIRRALDKLEQSLFWDGFDEEAEAYLKAYPAEHAERRTYEGVSRDGSARRFATNIRRWWCQPTT